MRKDLTYSNYLNVKHIFAFSSLNYLQSGISFIASIILARSLGADVYGHFAYGLVFANTLMVLMQFGTDKTLVRDLVQMEKPERTLTGTAILWFFLSIIGIIGIAIWSFFISDISTIAAWVLMLCTLSGAAQGLTVQAWFDVNEKMSLHAVFSVIGRSVFLIGIVIVLFFLRNEYAILWAAFLLLLSRLITLFLEWNFVLSSVRLIFKEAVPILKKIVSTNSWVWLAAIGNLLMTQGNQLILKDQAGIKQLAYYSVAFQIIMLVRMLQSQIVRLVAPSIANITNDKFEGDIIPKFLRFCGISFLASSVILLPLYFLTPFIVNNFLGEEFIPAIPVMNVLYVWVSIYGIALINNQFLIGLRKEKTFLKITVIFGLLSLILAYFLIKEFHAVGGALSLLIAHLSSIIFQFLIVIKTIKK